jgi:uncharacterized protein YjbI with pentapeptide repeats
MVGGCLMGVHLIGVHLMGVHLIRVYLVSVYLISVHLTGVYLMSVHLTGVRLTGVYLTGVHLIGVYLTGVHLMGVATVPLVRNPSYNLLAGFSGLQSVFHLLAWNGLFSPRLKAALLQLPKARSANTQAIQTFWLSREFGHPDSLVIHSSVVCSQVVGGRRR